MKYDSVSLRRRYLMIAGVAGIAAPAGLLAAGARAPDTYKVEPLIVSGRIVDPAGKPLANAVLEVADASTTTDGDGRFMVRTIARIARDCPESMQCRITHSAQRAAKTLEFVRRRVVRDETGTWRAGVSLNVA